MSRDELEVGQIYAECWGYSMTLYKFWKVVKLTDKSVFLQEYDSKFHPSTTNCFRPLVVPNFDCPKGTAVRKKINTYFGRLWDGEPCQEKIIWINL